MNTSVSHVAPLWQASNPSSQTKTQLPKSQLVIALMFVPQDLPHPLQLLGSVCVLVQVVPQRVWPVAQPPSLPTPESLPPLLLPVSVPASLPPLPLPESLPPLLLPESMVPESSPPLPESSPLLLPL